MNNEQSSGPRAVFLVLLVLFLYGAAAVWVVM
jgi:hypothetical protein